MHKKVLPQNSFTLHGTITATGIAIFSWAQTSGTTLRPAGSTTNSYISFGANTMIPGAVYAYTLTMNLSNGSVFKATGTWITNKGPICDGLFERKPRNH